MPPDHSLVAVALNAAVYPALLGLAIAAAHRTEIRLWWHRRYR